MQTRYAVGFAFLLAAVLTLTPLPTRACQDCDYEYDPVQEWYVGSCPFSHGCLDALGGLRLDLRRRD